MKTLINALKGASLATLLGLSATASANGNFCVVDWKDGDGNGVGSVDGHCVINQKRQVEKSTTPSFMVLLQGDKGESRVIFPDSYLPYGNDGTASYPHFEDGNKNGEGTVKGTVNFFQRKFKSRHVTITAFISGQSVRLFSGYVY